MVSTDSNGRSTAGTAEGQRVLLLDTATGCSEVQPPRDHSSTARAFLPYHAVVTSSLVLLCNAPRWWQLDLVVICWGINACRLASAERSWSDRCSVDGPGRGPRRVPRRNHNAHAVPKVLVVVELGGSHRPSELLFFGSVERRPQAHRDAKDGIGPEASRRVQRAGGGRRYQQSPWISAITPVATPR